MWQRQITFHVRGTRGSGRKNNTTNHKDESEMETLRSHRPSLKIGDVIGQTQEYRKGVGSSVKMWWSKTEAKEKRDMVLNEIRLN